MHRGIFKEATWDPQGLFLHRRYSGRAAETLVQLNAMTTRCEVVLVEEAHGSAAHVDTLRREISDFEAWLAPSASAGGGALHPRVAGDSPALAIG